MSYSYVLSFYLAGLAFITESYSNARYANTCMTFLLKTLEFKAIYFTYLDFP